MISNDGLLLHNKHKCKDVPVTYQGSCKSAENIIEGKEMKNHKLLIRIFFSFNFVSTQFLLSRNIDFTYIFYAKKRLVNRLTRHILNPPLELNFVNFFYYFYFSYYIDFIIGVYFRAHNIQQNFYLFKLTIETAVKGVKYIQG